MTPCTRKTWLGRPACKFEARYDDSQNNFSPVEGMPGMMTYHGPRRVYVRDCCVRCGKTVEREKRE